MTLLLTLLPSGAQLVTLDHQPTEAQKEDFLKRYEAAQEARAKFDKELTHASQVAYDDARSRLHSITDALNEYYGIKAPTIWHVVEAIAGRLGGGC